MPNADQLSALERLIKLRDSGTLSEEEFAAQKAAILTASNPTVGRVPFYRRLWLVVTLTCLLVTFWVSLIILATGNVYKRAKDGSLMPIKSGTRHVYTGLLALWLVALVVKAVVDPTGLKQDWASSAPTPQASSGTPQSEPPKATTPGSSASSATPTVTKSSTSVAAAPSTPPPEMSIQTGPSAASNVTALNITANDDGPFTVQRVVINGRKNETGCDIVHSDDTSQLGYTILTTPLKRGDVMQVLVDCGDKVLSADIYTDRGVASFKLDTPGGN